MSKKEIQISMVWPEEKLGVPPEPVLPDGYILRQYEPADEEAYLELTRRAGFDWGIERFNEMRPKIIPDGIFVIEHEATGTLVATSFCKNEPSEKHPAGGELGWVAGDPDHAGQGLGVAVCAAVTARFIEAGYRDIYLITQDWRLPAIKTYLKLGYEPEIDSNEMTDVWETIFQNLNWPPA